MNMTELVKENRRLHDELNAMTLAFKAALEGYKPKPEQVKTKAAAPAKHK